MAYAALLSLTHILQRTLKYDYSYLLPDEKKQVETLEKKVGYLQVFLDKSTQESSKSTEDLESQIKYAAYQGEDIIESSIMNRVLRESASQRGDSCTTFCHEIEILIENFDLIKKRAEKIVDKRGIQEDLQRSTSLTLGSVSHEKCTMVGLDDDLMEIKTRLVRDSPELQTVSIVGMGGIGKTTLARKVFVDEFIMYHFHIRVWVTVSQEYNERKFLLNLLDTMNIPSGSMYEESNEHLAELLYKSLKGKRYFMVMDDVWDTKVWDDVKRYFPNDRNRSRILLTTRLENVANCSNSCPPLHHLRFLDDDESWDLFCEKTFGEGCCPHELEEVSKKIARNCRGLPLSVVVIGGLLSKAAQTLDYWTNIAENLSLVVSSIDEQCSKILFLSYNYLPHHLKGCFLYMGIFPEDFSVSVSDLIKLWVAEGILKPDRSKTLEDVARGNISDLVERSLILIHEKSSSEKIKTFRIHDLLRDLCAIEARKEKFFHVTNGSLHGIQEGASMRCLSIHQDKNILHGDEKMPSSLSVRSLLNFGCEHHSVEPFSSSPLRVLYMKQMRCLPNEITDSVNLRYLNCFFMNPTQFIASLYKLRNLQTILLLVQNCPVLLPQEIWNMLQLRNVNVKRILCLPDPPSSEEYSNVVLENLQKLSMIYNFKCTEEVIKRIPNIQKLGILYDDESVDLRHYCLHNLVHLGKLTVLKCSLVTSPESFLQNITFPTSLKKLTLYGSLFSWEEMTIIGLLSNLEVLKLQYHAFSGPTWESNEGEFLQLKFLLLDTIYLEHWIADNIHFPRLQHLVIKNCNCLEEIPSGIGEIPTLQSIKVHYSSDSVVTSAKQIKEEQLSFGNYGFQLHIRENHD